jgi:hypothetical protein
MEDSKADSNKIYYKQLVRDHDDIKSFKAEQAPIILQNYKGELGKFNRTCSQPKSRKNLSSTSMCTYTITLYSNLWEERGNFGFSRDFDSVNDYWTHIMNVLSDVEISDTDIEAPDEFTILNVIPLLAAINEKRETPKDISKIEEIVESLAQEFIQNQFVYREKGIHPFLYYRFLVSLQNWKKALSPERKKRIAESLMDKFGAEVLAKFLREKKLPPESSQKKVNHEMSQQADGDKCEYDWCFDWFFDTIYDHGKYELYRQIALYYSNDKTLFDVKRLVYSLLIVSYQGRYSNNFVVQKALYIIFKEQLDTGLLPIGHVVDNDFVMINATIEKREVSAVPLVTSFECFTDMLSVEELREDLKPYEQKFRLAYEWTKRRLRKNTDKLPLGWYSEYESTHTPESWVAAHVLLFLKYYCELLSALMRDLQQAGQQD